MNSHWSRRWHEGVRKTSDERQYLITPQLGHQKTDEYMKDKRKSEPEAKTESVCAMLQWTEMLRVYVFDQVNYIWFSVYEHVCVCSTWVCCCEYAGGSSVGFMMAGCVFWEGAGVDLGAFPGAACKPA